MKAVFRRLLSCVALAVFSASAMVPASAAATRIIGVQVAAPPTGGVIVSVQFNSVIPKATVAGGGTAEAAVIFENTDLSENLPPTIAGAGPVTSVTIASNGPNSSVSLHLTGPGTIRIRPAGANAIFLDVAVAGSARPTAVAAPQSSVAGLGPVVVVVPLKYADVSEIAGVLVQGSSVASNDNFQPSNANFGTSSFGGFGQSGGFQGPVTQTPSFQLGQGQGVAQRISDNVAIDRRLNAVILSGTQDVVDGLHSIVDKLDVPLDSVVLETQIVELSESASNDLGIDFNGTGSVASATAEAKTNGAPAFDVTLQAALYAQVAKGHGRILAKPRIVAQSGTSASILTGDAIPIVTQVVGTGATTISGEQVNYVNVGVNLQILPRVSSDGFVTSHIFSEVSSVTATTSTGIPTISQRQAVTTATVRDGEAFVIGGLLQEDEIDNFTKVPGIGDLPLIGEFFKRRTHSLTKTNLYLVVTPHIVPRSGPSP